MADLPLKKSLRSELTTYLVVELPLKSCRWWLSSRAEGKGGSYSGTQALYIPGGYVNPFIPSHHITSLSGPNPSFFSGKIATKEIRHSHCSDHQQLMRVCVWWDITWSLRDEFFSGNLATKELALPADSFSKQLVSSDFKILRVTLNQPWTTNSSVL